MKRATLGDELRAMAMRVCDDIEQREAIAERLSMEGLDASEKLATAAKTIARQRAENRRLRAFAREMTSYACACGDGDVCVGCQARAALRRRGA